MKISPVAGTPTIPKPASTGLSVEKLQKIKSIAMGQAKGEPAHEETVDLEEKVPPTDKVLKMQTLKTPEPINAPQAGEGGGIPLDQAAQENGISDAGVQANPEPEATQPVSPQVAALAKQRRALQIKERELAEKEKALSERDGKTHSRAELEQRVKNGQALSVLQDLGITYDQLTNELLGQQTAPDLTKIKEEILKSVDERLVSKDTAQEEAVFAHIEKNIGNLATEESYPFVKAEGAEPLVLDLIKRAWKEDGEVLDEEDALKLIETELEEKAKKLAKLLKEPEPTTQVPAETSQKPQVTPGIKTLTNKDSARPQSNRRQRALAAFLSQK